MPGVPPIFFQTCWVGGMDTGESNKALDADLRGLIRIKDAFSFLACTQKTKSTFQFVLAHKMKTLV